MPPAAAALGLPLAPEDLSDVIGAFAVLARVAGPVMAFALPEELIAAAVFVPGRRGARMSPGYGVCATAAAVRAGDRSAVEVARAALARIAARDDAQSMPSRRSPRSVRCADAAAVDAKRAAGHDPGPLAGVPFAVKNLYDIAGIATVAGSRIDRDRTPASRDAALVRRLAGQGAVLVGALNMDEYAYGFSTENSHYGATRNPHDPAPYRRRLVGRLGGRGCRISGAADARLRHQWLDPGAGGAVRRVRIAADLRPVEPRRHAAVRVEPRRRRPLRAFG